MKQIRWSIRVSNNDEVTSQALYIQNCYENRNEKIFWEWKVIRIRIYTPITKIEINLGIIFRSKIITD